MGDYPITYENIERLIDPDISYYNSVDEDEGDWNLAADTITSSSLKKFLRFLCPRCGKQFKNEPAWQWHLETDHSFNDFQELDVYLTEDGSSYCCIYCSRLYPKNEYRMILEHCFTHMFFWERFKCGICDQTFAQQPDLLRHIRRHYEVHLLRARTERKLIRGSSYRLKLTKDASFEKFLQYICPICLRRARSERQWLMHIERKHDLFSRENRRFRVLANENEPNDYFWPSTCEDCGLRMAYNDAECQFKHRLTHMHFKSFRCVICKLRLNYKAEIELHIPCLHATKNPEVIKPDSEDDCNEGEFSIWLTEEKSKIAEKYQKLLLYFCPTCNVELENYNDWSEHIAKNHDFFRPRYLSMHYQVLVNGKTLHCFICKAKLLNCKTTFMRHFVTHMPYAPHGCAICKQKSVNIYSLIKHINSNHLTKNGVISKNGDTEDKRSKRRKILE